MKSRPVNQIIIAMLLKLLLNTGRRFIYPFAPFVSRGLDVPLAAVTSIIATTQAVTLLGLFSGPLTDRIGYRFMMRAGVGVLAIGMLICGLVPDYWPVFLGLVLASFGKTLFDPAILAFVGHTVPFEKRGRVIGIIEISWAGSTLIGIPALALIIEHGGLQISFSIMALLGGIGWVILGWTFPPDRQNPVQAKEKMSFLLSFKQLLQSRPAVGMLAFGFWISLANDSLFVVYGAWFEQAFLVSIVTLGFSTVAIGCAELLGESLTAIFADRIELKRSIVIGLVLTVCSYILLPIIGRTLPLAMVGMFCVFLTFEISIVTSFSLSTELLPEARATMMAGFYATAGIGRMIGVLVGGALWEFGGITTVCWSAAGITTIGLLSLLWGLIGWRKP